MGVFQIGFPCHMKHFPHSEVVFTLPTGIYKSQRSPSLWSDLSTVLSYCLYFWLHIQETVTN